MSEYVVIEADPTDDPDIYELQVNQALTQAEREHYATPADGEAGSPIAQALFTAVDGLRELTIFPDMLLVRRDPATPWEALLDDVRDALRDFFL